MLAFSAPQSVRQVLDKGLERRTPYTIANPKLFREELLRIQQDGVAYDREEVALGLTCIAAPILKSGRAVAAVVHGRVAAALASCISRPTSQPPAAPVSSPADLMTRSESVPCRPGITCCISSTPTSIKTTTPTIMAIRRL